MAECRRSNDPRRQCPARFPGRADKWCRGCQQADEQAQFDQWVEANFGPPCPLEAHQIEAYQHWLALEPLDWYSVHLANPSRN